MSIRRGQSADRQTERDAGVRAQGSNGEAPASALPTRAAPSGLAARRAAPRSREEAEERYVAARDAWIQAMRASASGRASDLASLAIAQEAYEAATEERELWESGVRVAIPIEPEPTGRGIDAIVGQELAWRKLHESEEEGKGLFGRLSRRLRGR